MGNDNFYNKFYNYLEECRMKKDIKCAIIVTDKQRVFSTINEMNFNKFTLDDDSHQHLISYLEDKIHPNNRDIGWESSKLHDLYILLKGPKIVVNLPLDGNLSLNQAMFLIDTLSNVCEFNAEYGDLISVDILSSDDYKEYCTHDINKIGKYILSKLSEFYIVTGERIVDKPSFDSNTNKSKIYKKQ